MLKKYFTFFFLINITFVVYAQDYDYDYNYDYEETPMPVAEITTDEEYDYYNYDYNYEEVDVSTPPTSIPPNDEPIISVPESEPILSPSPTTAPPTNTEPLAKIPLFQTYKPQITVDPTNPILPSYHRIARLRGTVWRSCEPSLRTNSRGVVSSQYLYIFFGKNQDSVAYTYSSHKRNAPSQAPDFNQYISLVPLLQTNTFTPITTTELRILSNDITERFQQPEIVISGDEESAITLSSNSVNTVTPDIVPTSTSTDPIPMENETYEYSDDYAFYLDKMDISYVAQAIYSIAPNQYVINIGGDNAGIFVHETGNTATPYKVIFLSLEQDGYLYGNIIDNSFDVRDQGLTTSKDARELYIKILNERINMRKFRQLPTIQPFFP